MNLSIRLKKYRGENQLTQKQMADKIGISRSYYCAIETETKEPSYRVLKSMNKIIPIFLTINATNRNEYNKEAN